MVNTKFCVKHIYHNKKYTPERETLNILRGHGSGRKPRRPGNDRPGYAGKGLVSVGRAGLQKADFLPGSVG